jgi:hypothetical protein
MLSVESAAESAATIFRVEMCGMRILIPDPAQFNPQQPVYVSPLLLLPFHYMLENTP